jgi:two-component system sensor histidine kinase PilS (NtrC family)
MPATPSFRPNYSTFGRSLQTLNVSRVVVAVILLLYLNLKSAHPLWAPGQLLFRETCVAYLVLAIAFVLLKIYWPRRFMLQLAVQTAVDISVISVLYMGTSGSQNGLAILYLFPLAGAGVLAPLVWALFFTSVDTGHCSWMRGFLFRRPDYMALRSLPWSMYSTGWRAS